MVRPLCPSRRALQPRSHMAMKHEAFRPPRSRTSIPAFTQGRQKPCERHVLAIAWHLAALEVAPCANSESDSKCRAIGQTLWPRPGTDFAGCLTKGQG